MQPDNKFLSDLSIAPSTQKIAERIVSLWPEHSGYLAMRFRDFDGMFEARIDELASLALVSIGDELDTYIADYRWMCEAFIEEEFHFRRKNKYRLSTFEEAYKEVYSRPEIMGRYVRGILISQIIWEAHARAFDFFRTHFIGKANSGSKYLEIGPGHGLFLTFASRQPGIVSLEAWDVSDSSIAETRHALSTLGVTRDICIVHQDILEAPSRHGEFDLAVISEVLEHLERPDVALQSLHAALRPNGRIFVNVPVNSPAPDHIYLWRSTEEFVSFFEAQGFALEEVRFFPVTGATLETARRKSLSISCVVIGQKIA
jgi:2-polyprenyl-3-methyl-5-hydroxy-6-metoxy-1,4-benzoquinol methylase